MTQKERLVDLLKSVSPIIGELCNAAGTHVVPIVSNSYIADYLLANGVIVPPCKVGDTVWFHICFEKGCLSTAKGEVTAIVEREGEGFLEICSYNIIICRSFDEVFFTSEAAEKALKERDDVG